MFITTVLVCISPTKPGVLESLLPSQKGADSWGSSVCRLGVIQAIEGVFEELLDKSS